MKFLADMGISPKAVLHLRQRGHDALHLMEENLHRLPDPDILAKSRRERRVLLTHDLDFGELMAASGAHLPSVVIFRLGNMAASQVNRHLDLILDQYAGELERGAILSITENRVRIRSLPIGT
ncbi:MAG: DUF5615 family PIN-like protein [Caldilineaceae bacterium]